jgi:hypothetical protein
MSRNERMRLAAAEKAGRGGVTATAGLAAGAWAVERFVSESWWCVPLALLACVLVCLAGVMLAEANYLYDRARGRRF